jgi:myo-inositol 2-dehydrogenase / D-chiro-inositol 1-dehydrogenase
MKKLCLLGAGRIGRVHAENVVASAGAELALVVDRDEAAARELSAKTGAKVASDAEAALRSGVDGVLIATSTDTHVELIELAVSCGVPVFCEKPVDLDLAKVEACLKTVREKGVPLMMGFNRRFDPSFAALKRRLDEGEVGTLELLRVTSRDPAPPPLAYAKVSGGLFRDMMIHDFDTARWLLGEEPVELYATGSCLVEPALGALGDVDTAVVVLKTAKGVVCTIDNSRRAVYGYDQRIEALGSGGMLLADNPTPTTVRRADKAAVISDKPPWFFLERYAEAYRAELAAFLAVLDGEAPPVTGEDGRRALLLAEAANRSLQERRAVALELA